MSDHFIETRDLIFSYDDPATDDKEQNFALRGVSTVIERGEYVAVVGRNGSGKSTFAKLLNLVLEPSGGDILIDGKSVCGDLTDDEIIELRRSIGMVFQNPDNQIVATIVEEDVAFGPENIGVPSAEIRKRVDDALAAVGMSDFAHHEPHRLSGGQKQRVAIAGIIAMMPDCMIFDESTAMLDPIGRAEVLETMEHMVRDRGITVLNITHHMSEAVRADRIIVMDNGKIIADATPKEIFADAALIKKAGLELPQSALLLHKLAACGVDVGEIPITSEDAVEMICALIDAK
jgi:energy-coupling factor transport system ATP-binding protein